MNRHWYYDGLEPTPEPYPEEVIQDIHEAMSKVASAMAAASNSWAQAIDPFADMWTYLKNIRVTSEQFQWHYQPPPSPPPKKYLLGIVDEWTNSLMVDPTLRYTAESIGALDIERIRAVYKEPHSIHKVESYWSKWLDGR